MGKEMEETVPPGRPCSSGSRIQPRVATPKRPISPPPSSQLSGSPARSHYTDAHDQVSQAERDTEAGTASRGPREANPGTLTPREKVKLLKLCYKHGRGILNAPVGCKRSEDESYQPVLEGFSAQVRAGFFKTSADVSAEVKNICRNRRKGRRINDGGVVLGKRSPEPAPGYDATIDQWVRVWDSRMLRIYLAKANQLMSEILRMLPPRAVDDELPEDLLEPRARKAYRKHMAAVVQSGRLGDRHPSDVGDSDESSPDSSDEEVCQNEMSGINSRSTLSHSIEQDVDLAASPSPLQKTPGPALDISPTRKSDYLLGLLGQWEEKTIVVLEKARQDGKGKNVSIRGLEQSGTEPEQRLLLTPSARTGNNAEGSPELGSLAATADAPTEQQRSPSLGIRPLAAIMNMSSSATPRKETTALPDLRGLSSSGPSESQANRIWQRAPVTSGPGSLDRGDTVPGSTTQSTTFAVPKPFNKNQANKRQTSTAPKASYRNAAPKEPKPTHTGIDPREIRPSRFYGFSPSPFGRDNTEDNSRSPPHGGSITTTKFRLPEPLDTPTRTPRRPFKYYADSILGDGDSPRPDPKLTSSSAEVRGGRSYDWPSDSEGLPDLEELVATHSHSQHAVTSGRKRQKEKGSTPPSQKSSTSATCDENQSAGRWKSQETNRDDIPSSTAARSRPLSEQPTSKLNPTSNTNSQGCAAERAINPQEGLSPHDRVPLSETLVHQRGRSGDSQARKRKKSSYQASSSPSPTLERRPAKRQRRQLPAGEDKPHGTSSPKRNDAGAAGKGGRCGHTSNLSYATGVVEPHDTAKGHGSPYRYGGHRASEAQAFSTPAKQISRGLASSPASSNLFVPSGSLTPGTGTGTWRTKRRKRKSRGPPPPPSAPHRRWRILGHEEEEEKVEEGEGEKGEGEDWVPNDKRTREMTAGTTDFEQLSPGRKYKQLLDRVKRIERRFDLDVV